MWCVVCAVPGITATPYEDNLRYFNVLISGPNDTPYDGATPARPPEARVARRLEVARVS